MELTLKSFSFLVNGNLLPTFKFPQEFYRIKASHFILKPVMDISNAVFTGLIKKLISKYYVYITYINITFHLATTTFTLGSCLSCLLQYVK